MRSSNSSQLASEVHHAETRKGLCQHQLWARLTTPPIVDMQGVSIRRLPENTHDRARNILEEIIWCVRAQLHKNVMSIAKLPVDASSLLV